MKHSILSQKKDRHYIVTTSSPSSPLSDGVFESDDVVTVFFCKIVTG